MPFRLQSKFFFLTYSQCPVDISDLQAHIHSLYDISYSITCLEKHKDGSDHRHIYFETETRLDIRDCRRFDLVANDITYHCSIEKPKHRGKCISYCKKEGDFYEFGSTNAKEACESKDIQPGDYGCETEWLEACIRARIPYGYANRLWQLYREHPVTIYGETDEIAGSILEPELQFRTLPPTGAVAVVGPTGRGKSVWAKKHAPKPAVLIRHMDDLKRVNFDEIKSIIFDDMDFKHWPVTTQIHLVDSHDDSTIHARYSNIRIPKEIRKIFTCNDKPLTTHPAILRRVTFIDFNKYLN